MSSPNNDSTSRASSQPSRRRFLKNSTLAAGGASLAGTLLPTKMVHASDDDTIKVALIGCGGRGSGAAVNACNADPNVKLTVMADMFEDKLESSRNNLRNSLGDKFAVDDEHCFTGFDSYKEAIATDVDVVLLATPPHFRPMQLAAAVEAGKHIFCEKPVAVDGPGIRSVIASVEKAKQKNLNLVSGLCWRYDLGVRATVERIQEGAIGDVLAVQENYLTGTLWHRGNKPEWSQMEYQLRNWLYFNWLSGDHINEQHIHSLDKGLWLMGDVPPLSCFGLGGRQVRTGEEYGHIYDHHAVCYDFSDNRKVFAYTRQMRGCFSNVEDYVIGSKGTAKILRHETKGDEDWRYSGPKPSMYDVEHQHLFGAIRSGETINDGEYMANSTLMAIMGRMACYTGKRVTWDQALNSTEDLSPAAYEFGDVETPSVALPGVTMLQ